MKLHQFGAKPQHRATLLRNGNGSEATTGDPSDGYEFGFDSIPFHSNPFVAGPIVLHALFGILIPINRAKF